jgi:hypothetical protein
LVCSGRGGDRGAGSPPRGAAQRATTISAVPLYVYTREDGSLVEIQHSIHDEALTVCPETGQPMERVLQAFGSAQLPPRFHAEGMASRRSSI